MPPEVRLLHQTRHPVNVINSLLQIQFLDLDAAGSPVRSGVRASFTKFAYQHCPQLLEVADVRQRTMWFYYHWNKAIDAVAEQRPILRYDIETLGPDRLRQILNHLRVPPGRISDERLAAHFEILPRNINAKTREKLAISEKVTWEELPAEVQALGMTYGYGPVSQAAQRIEGWNEDLARAQNDVRKQARTLLAEWQVERTELTSEMHTLRERTRLAEEEAEHVRRRLQAAQKELAEERLYRDHQQFDGRESEEARLARDYWMCREVTRGPVLDVCCGRGTRTILLAREGLKVVGVEDGTDALTAAKTALADERDSVQQLVQLREGPLLATELAPASFHSVILADALTRVTHPQRLLEHVCAALADNGRLVVCVPLGYHPDQDRLYTFSQLRTLLTLLGCCCNIDGVRVVHDYACVATTKPAEETPVTPPTEEQMRVWDRLGEETLMRIQRRWLRDRAGLSASNLQLERLCEKHEQLRDELVQARELLIDARTESQKTQGERDTAVQLLERARGERDAAFQRLERAQAIQVRLAGSCADIPDQPLDAPTDSSGKPTQESGGFLFFCVNGAGLGHVTRSLAIARRIRRIDPAMPIYFLSSSQALRIMSREGMIPYYVPPRSEYGDRVGGNAWNALLLQQLRTVVGMHHPAVLVYDGVSPYKGLLDSISEADFVYTAMILRLRHKHGRLLDMTDRLNRFDELIFPGEPGVEVPPELTILNHRVFDPVVFLDPDELLPRNDVRRSWGITDDRKTVYIQLGAGNIDDITPWINELLFVLNKRDDVEVILAESPIAGTGHKTDRPVRILTQYPNSLFFRGIDLAITATGYNTFHELMHFGVPTIFIPNQKTVTDDQVARSMTARDNGAALVALQPSDLESLITEALSGETARTMGQCASQLVPRNGAMDIAQALVASASERLSHRMAAQCGGGLALAT